jgi:hypothetical protein
MFNECLTNRPGYSMKKESFAVLWYSFAGDGAKALRELIPVSGMTDRSRTMLQKKLESDPYVRQRIAELQGVAAERAIDDAAYLREQLTALVEDARLEGKYTAAAAALGQFAKMAGLDGVQRVDVTTAGQPVTMTRRIIDPKAPTDGSTN